MFSVNKVEHFYILPQLVCTPCESNAEVIQKTKPKEENIDKMTETEVTDKIVDVVKEQTPSDDETIDKMAIYPQIIAAVVVNLTLLVSGLCYAWPSVTLLYYEKSNSPIKMTSEQESWVVTGVPLGAVIGPLGSALLVDRIGRKWFVFATCLPFVAGWILLYIANSWVYLFVGRLFTGIPTGAIFAAVPQYLGELVDTKIRGAANVMVAILLNVGYIIVYGVGPLVDPKMLALICLVPTILVLIWLPWLPESPYYYLKKNNKKDANLSLTWLRRNTENTKAMEEMTKFIELERSGGLKQLFTKPVNRRALYIMLLLLTGQQFSGLMAIQSYAGVLIRDLGQPFRTEMTLLILGVIGLISGIMAAFIIDRVGRKPLYLSSAYVCAVCLGMIGTYYLLENLRFNVKSYNLVPVVLLLIYYVGFNLGVSSVPAVVSSEIFPLGVKMWASAVVNTFGSALALVVSKSYQPILDVAGKETVFYIFCGVELIIATTAIFLMPETSGKSFWQIQIELNDTISKKNIDEEMSTKTNEELA